MLIGKSYHFSSTFVKNGKRLRLSVSACRVVALCEAWSADNFFSDNIAVLLDSNIHRRGAENAEKIFFFPLALRRTPKEIQSAFGIGTISVIHLKLKLIVRQGYQA
jgi:hypothetical protein